MRDQPAYREAMRVGSGMEVSALAYLDPARPGMVQAKVRAGENRLTLPWLRVDELRSLVACLRCVESLHRCEREIPTMDDYQDGFDVPMGHPASPQKMGAPLSHW
jgi:hypothetical protein